MTSVSDMKEFINTDLKNYDAYKKLLHLRKFRTGKLAQYGSNVNYV